MPSMSTTADSDPLLAKCEPREDKVSWLYVLTAIKRWFLGFHVRKKPIGLGAKSILESPGMGTQGKRVAMIAPFLSARFITPAVTLSVAQSAMGNPLVAAVTTLKMMKIIDK
jgi:hypothetical protein